MPHLCITARSEALGTQAARAPADRVIFTVRLLGLEVLHIELAQPEAAADDLSRDLSGGTVASTPINVAWRPGQGIDHEPESPYEEVP